MRKNTVIGFVILIVCTQCMQCTISKVGKTERAVSDKDIHFQYDTVYFLNKKYILCKVNSKQLYIDLFNEKPGKGVYEFSSILEEMKTSGEKLLFAMNAGMYKVDLHPLGLFIKDYRTVNPINLGNGQGNFYVPPPNGIFAVDTAETPFLFPRTDYDSLSKKMKFRIATQSGPMLVIHDSINRMFTKGSVNLNIRNGVGVDKAGMTIFIISMDKVNFYEFSQLFRDSLGCKNALYLDGFVSQWFIPEKHEPIVRNLLGPIFTISLKKK